MRKVGRTELISAIGITCSIEMINMNPTSRVLDAGKAWGI